ncbi:type IV secretory pathway VirD4 component, partial [mine drainage metagenome]
RHKRGDQLRSDSGTIQKQIQNKIGKADGIFVHSGIRIPETLEVRSFSLVGAPGSGKTTVLNGMVDQAVQRGDKCLLFDFKGDFTERIPDGKKIFCPLGTPGRYAWPWAPMFRAKFRPDSCPNV